MAEVVQAVVCSVVVDGALIHALLYSAYELKATQMNMQHSLIWKLMLYEFKLGYNTMEATKDICCVKDEGVVDHNTVTR